MPWWFWILLWIALIALSLLLHLTLGYRLYRKFMSTVHELAAAGKRFSNLSPVVETSDVDGANPRPEPGSAIFASPDQMRHDYLTAKAFRQEVRRQRRVKRKAERGQPQSLHDIEIR
ncbi:MULTISPECIES: hypothetical protein [Micrococcaceae]|jgi:hypothetical protein|uniref:Uncharacterized protein n=1 Tax=Paenarthrobacter aurescens (strain TC1) TaxID=290340 RepID=A1R6R3_PAEAT|nr:MULTISPECIES: hypothetical protein [Micrococcaceae]ABM07859.1 hypothetical protein AAur_2183 [Paenarthrobacter aurescens TC1]AFR29239.1 hypothetical protein ARUE_c23380 [Arthrobacter sp. Rue61a]